MIRVSILLALLAPTALAGDDPAHWAFVPPARVEPPPVKEAGWPRNVLDHFVLARLEAEGLHHAPEADRSTLLRRLSFDLIGLPPSPEEVAAFEADQAPDAYEKQVDRLLASPHHGEHDRLLWRQGRRRLDGEAIRDALLAASGRLNRSIGGPCVFPELPGELTRLIGKGKAWPVSPRAEDRDRRSLYVFTRRNLRYPFFEAFDRPDTNASCPRRATTTIAPQPLSLLNGELAQGSARALADRVGREVGPEPSAQVDRAYRLALGRGPEPGELALGLTFLGGDDRSGLADFCLALLNLNEFVYLD